MMRNLKYDLYKKYLVRIVAVILALLIFKGICGILNYMYVSVGDNLWGRILWHNFYNDDGKIDNIFLGSSHVYSGINPAQLDEVNGQYNFNLATPRQGMNASYYLLKEADKNNTLSHVYLEMYYWCSVKDNFNSGLDYIDTEYFRNWCNIDYMKNSYNKLEYMLSIAGTEKYVDMLFPFTRYRSNLNNWDYVKQTMKDKMEDSYLMYEYDMGTMAYMKQGRLYNTRVFPDEDRIYEQGRILEEDPIGEKSENYIRKIISYCQERNISITLFIVPVDELMLISTEGYDNYINQVKGIAEEFNVPFYDFNLAKKEYLPIRYGEHFVDAGHLNSVGSDIFTSFFSEVVAEDFSENGKYFYKSYAEKLQAESPLIYGIYYRDSEVKVAEEAKWLRTFRIASNGDMEYRIILTPNEGEQYMVQDFMENKEFTVSPDDHGVCTIVTRMKEDSDAVQTLEISY